MSRAVQPIPPGHHSAFVALGAALGVQVDLDAVHWGPWQAENRAKGYQVARESACGAHREFVTNEVRRVKVFRSLEAAERVAVQRNGGAA